MRLWYGGMHGLTNGVYGLEVAQSKPGRSGCFEYAGVYLLMEGHLRQAGKVYPISQPIKQTRLFLFSLSLE